jgi:hypothetical protein
MADTKPKFRHEVIDPDPPGAQHDITLIADINADGRNEIIIGGKEGPPNLFWYENGTWRRHDLAEAEQLEAGGVVFDVNGDGRPDIIAGQQWEWQNLYWFENPPDPTQPWTRRVIENRFKKYHDQAVGDVDGDGKPELVAHSQRAGVLFYYDIPDDPTVEPWPAEGFHMIAEGFEEEIEGLRIVDLDGDGRNEIVAGPHVYRIEAGRPVLLRTYAPGYTKTRVAVADLTGDGRLDIVIAEGESHPGRLAICSPPEYRPRVLRDDLFHPHSLEVADFRGTGRADIFVAEMGLGRNPDPKMLILLNAGGGHFEEFLVARGVPTHEAKVGDLTGDGRPDIIGKPYEPERHVDVWFNET